MSDHYISVFNGASHLKSCDFGEEPFVGDADKITPFLAVLTPRKIDAGHCIRFRNKYYAPTDEQGCRADFYKGTAAIVIRTLSGKLYVYAMAGKEEQ